MHTRCTAPLVASVGRQYDGGRRAKNRIFAPNGVACRGRLAAMRIKRLVIKGFRSYLSLVDVEEFHPGYNVIVGRNGGRAPV